MKFSSTKWNNDGLAKVTKNRQAPGLVRRPCWPRALISALSLSCSLAGLALCGQLLAVTNSHPSHVSTHVIRRLFGASASRRFGHASLAVPDRSGPDDPSEFESFLAPVVTRLMRKYQIPGAAFVLVKDGKLFFARGYGWANLVKKIPVDPHETVFRVASVTKLFPTAAVMQLASEGKLELHVNVNRYLKLFKLPAKYSQPVTLSALLTHTAGFEDLSIGVAARPPSRREPLGFYLSHHMPAEIRPPGLMISYSSHGMALAGYVVQVVSGEPYAAYIQNNILTPLGMTRSGFLPSAQLEHRLAIGYERWHGLHAVPYDHFNIQPASGLCSTPDNMAHFMIAMLDSGNYDGAEILSPSSAADMERQHFTEDPRLSGRAYGFYEKRFDGLRVIGHGGDIRGFGSMLTLVPEKRLGFFIAENVDEPRFDQAIERRFINRYFPRTRKSTSVVRDSVVDADRVAGSYRLNPYSATTFAKLFTLYWQYRVTPNPDGSIELHYPHHYRPATRWVELQPLYYERPATDNKAVFLAAANGHITEMFTDEEAFDRLRWYAVAHFQVGLVEILLLIFLSSLVLYPAAILRHIARYRSSQSRGQGSSDRRLPFGATLARWTAASAAALVIFFILGFLEAFRRTDLWDFAYGVPRVFRELLLIPPLTAVLAAAVVIFSVCAWPKPWWGVFARVHFTILAGAGIVWVWFLIYWNLLIRPY